MLTLYELLNGEMTLGQGTVSSGVGHGFGRCAKAYDDLEFHGMDPELFQRSLNVLVERGKARVFGSEDQQGVKFF